MFLRSLAIPLIAISFTFVNPCSKGNQSPKPKADDIIYEVTTIHPEFVSVPKTHNVDGVFEPSEVNTITANFYGEIEQIFVDVGDTIEKDDPVVTLSNTDIIEDIDIQRSRIKELKAKLKEIQARLEIEGGEDQPLTTDDSEFLDEDNNEDAPTPKQFGNANEPQQTPKTLKALGELLDAQVETLTKQADALDRKLLALTQNSPVSGIVTKKFTSEGNKVKEQDPIIEISKTNPLSVTFFLPDNIASFIDKNTKVSVSPTDAPEIISKGTVYFINPNIDTATGQIEIRAHVANTKNLIKGGQKAIVRVATRKMERVIVLPKRVLYYEDNKPFVFIVSRNQAKLAQVNTGDETEDGKIQIYGDLRVDDEIIIDRPLELKHNSFVKVVTQKND